MAIPKIIGAQRDFSAGEIDVALKRSDENPIMKTGARQLSNFRILSGGQAQNRPGRRALFLEADRVEEILMSPGNVFFLVFRSGYLRVYNAAGTNVFSSATKGDGTTAIPWTSATVKNITFAVAAGSQLAIYIAYGDDAPLNVPQILTWDGVSQTSTWTLATYAETITPSGQKRTVFNRLSPQNVTLLPSAVSGVINITFSSNVLVAGMVGIRLTYCGRQIVIASVTDGMHGTATVIELLPPSQALSFSSSAGGFNFGDVVKGSVTGASGIVTSTPATQLLTVGSVTGGFYVGDAVVGATSGATGIVTSAHAGVIGVHLSTGTQFVAAENISGPSGHGYIAAVSGIGLVVQIVPTAAGIVTVFAGTETVVGPSGSGVLTSATIGTPQAISVWDDEVMNLYRGYPTSVFYDQNRLGFCNFPAQPSAIGWGAIGLPSDFYVSAVGATVTASSAIYELAPGKSQVLFVQAGMESSEFIFCDNAIYYLPITPQNPLTPGSVSFTLLNAQGSEPIRPQAVQQSIIYVKRGGTEIGAVQAPGAYYRPYVVDEVSEFHSHLFIASPPIAIAVPTATGQFEEDYAYILLQNGTLVIAKFGIKSGLLDSGQDGKPKMGWLPWSGSGSVNWISAQGQDLIFTTTYAVAGAAPVSVAEVLDSQQFLDCQISVAAPPTPFVTAGKGPLYFLAGGSVTLFDGALPMGTYKIDANGNIIPQFNGGENLSSAALVAGQPWTAVLEPFIPDAPPGQSVHQRMWKRRVSRMAVYVSNSSGFLLARLFSGPITPATAAAGQALGAIMNTLRIPTWNIGDNVEIAPPLREEAYRWRPLGRSFDPRVALVKDTPGPLTVHEIGLEASI